MSKDYKHSSTIKNKKLYFLIFLNIILFFVYHSIYLNSYARNLVYSSIKLDSEMFAANDTYSISRKLTNLSSNIEWVCLSGKYKANIFFEKTSGDCRSGFFQKEIIIVPEYNKSLELKLTLRLPDTMEWLMLIFLVFQMTIVITIFLITKKNTAETLAIHHDYEIKLKSEKIEKLEIMSLLANQVAHDIRSPLAALDMALKDSDGLSEEKRVMVRTATNRIHEIFNDLLNKNKKIGHEKSDEKHTILISSIIESLVAEKRVQFRNKQNINIQTSFNSSSYGIFTSIVTSDFKRILSNLINNSVEAFKNNQGQITVSSKRIEDSKQVVIEVEDNGAGIPEDILKKLGVRGVSFGKEGSKDSGSGLGLFHAKSTIESWGGKFEITSKVGKGTSVKIFLNEDKQPKTFVPAIYMNDGHKIVILDDDQSIHQIWDGRFASVKYKEHNIEIFHFSNFNDASEWLKDNKADTYLIDYEFVGAKQTGLDFIKTHNLMERAILVTSRYEEEHVQKDCERLGVGLVPKGLAVYIPILINENLKQTRLLIQDTTILVDDDGLVRLIWATRAKEKNIKIKIYGNHADFIRECFDYCKETSTIYIDSELKDNFKGEELAKYLHEEGFKNLYLETGYEPEHFTHLGFLKGVMGKTPPW